MIFSEPKPFRAALEQQEVKSILPTSLGSYEIKKVIEPEILERAFHSARNESAVYLQIFHDGIQEMINPVTKYREDGTPYTDGLDQPTLRVRMKELGEKLGLGTEDELVKGTLKDHLSDKRLNLVIETNLKMAQGYGHWQQGQDEFILDEFPAQELFRAEERMEPRDWISRWRDAGGVLYDGGRMIAPKNDPIWTEISAFGHPYPPFDYQSGMEVRDISRDEAIELGVIDPDDEKIQAQDRDFNEDLKYSEEIRAAGLRQVLEEQGQDYVFDEYGVFRRN